MITFLIRIKWHIKIFFLNLYRKTYSYKTKSKIEQMKNQRKYSVYRLKEFKEK